MVVIMARYMNPAPRKPSPQAFRVGITPDFYRDAKGRFESALEAKLSGVEGLEYGAMPPQPDNIAQSYALNAYDALFSLALKITSNSVKEVERLAVIARWGVGYDMIDVDALTAADIALAITPNAVRRPVAEAIFTFIFALTTNLLEQDRTVRAGKWRGSLPRLGRNIKGKTLGSLGCGNIAQEMFAMARAFGFGRLIACDPYAPAEKAAALGVELVSLDELLASSDFLTINTLLNSQTRGMIGESELRRMKPSAYLINTARGPIVRQAALIDALRAGRIAGAGLDVFEEEPLEPGSPLRDLDNVILTPHGLAWTEEIVRDNGLEACSNILSIARGEAPSTIVNKEVIGRPGFQAKLARYRRIS
jgi:phosphoglycerate dehydrogenase-like enzyme